MTPQQPPRPPGGSNPDVAIAMSGFPPERPTGPRSPTVQLAGDVHAIIARLDADGEAAKKEGAKHRAMISEVRGDVRDISIELGEMRREHAEWRTTASARWDAIGGQYDALSAQRDADLEESRRWREHRDNIELRHHEENRQTLEAIKAELAHRKLQDSIHEEDITGVTKLSEEAKRAAREAEAKADKAHDLATETRALLTPKEKKVGLVASGVTVAGGVAGKLIADHWQDILRVLGL